MMNNEEALKKLSDGELLRLKKIVENKEAKYNNEQLVRKVQLNSAYGAVGCSYFRFFDIRQAEAITLTGQMSIRWVTNAINKFLNQIVEVEEDHDFAVAGDTDSCYLSLGPLVEQECDEDATRDDIVDFLDKFADESLQPVILKAYQEFALYLNSREQVMDMDREVIADHAIWTAKKRYAMNVLDSEGVRHDTPELEIKGIETTRSSTPEVCRNSLKEAIRIALNGGETELQEFVKDTRKDFFALPPEDVSFPRGANKLKKYADKKTIYKKGTPIAVRGALLYNDQIDKLGLGDRYEKVQSGEKVKFCYLTLPNVLKEDVISYVGQIPPEFGVHDYVDYQTQWEKAFIDPLQKILDVIGWNHKKIQTLEDFFGG